MRRMMLAVALACFASPTLADVIDCKLEPTEGILSPTLSVYFHDGITHSATLVFTTDYGDTLPYLFACKESCKMEMVGDDYRYFLGVEPALQNPKLVVLVTESKNDDFRIVDVLEVEGCQYRR